jgi:hypothetical protein
MSQSVIRSPVAAQSEPASRLDELVARVSPEVLPVTYWFIPAAAPQRSR